MVRDRFQKGQQEKRSRFRQQIRSAVFDGYLPAAPCGSTIEFYAEADAAGKDTGDQYLAEFETPKATEIDIDGIVVADGGFAAHWGGLMFDTKQAGRHFLPDRGFASIGYGVPGGIGAQIGVGPGRKVVSLTDYGAFVEVEEGIDGLIHRQEGSALWTGKRPLIKNVYREMRVMYVALPEGVDTGAMSEAEIEAAERDRQAVLDQIDDQFREPDQWRKLHRSVKLDHLDLLAASGQGG